MNDLLEKSRLAKWIWARGPFNGPLHFALFRKTFITDRGGIRARISCAADSKYRLWLNGKYIGFGPAQASGRVPRGLTGKFIWDRSNGRVSSISIDGRPGRERGAHELAEGDHAITVRCL